MALLLYGQSCTFRYARSKFQEVDCMDTWANIVLSITFLLICIGRVASIQWKQFGTETHHFQCKSYIYFFKSKGGTCIHPTKKQF